MEESKDQPRYRLPERTTTTPMLFGAGVMSNILYTGPIIQKRVHPGLQATVYPGLSMRQTQWGLYKKRRLVSAAPSIGVSRATLLGVSGMARTAFMRSGGMALALSVALPVAIIVDKAGAVTGAFTLVGAIGRTVGMFRTLDSLIGGRFCFLYGSLICRVYDIVIVLVGKSLDAVDTAGEHNCD
jgi:hypothetical protein